MKRRRAPFSIRRLGRSWHVARWDGLGYVYVSSHTTHAEAIRSVFHRWPYYL